MIPRYQPKATSCERISVTTSCDELNPIEAVHLLAPYLAPYVSIQTDYPAEACFGAHHRISLNVAPTDIKTMVLDSEGLYHNGRHYSSDTLRKALELAFPEDFI